MKKDLNKRKPLIAAILALQTIVSIGFLIYAFYKHSQNQALKVEIDTLKSQVENCQTTQPK